MALDLQMVLQRGLMACYRPAKNSNISKSFSSPKCNMDWALFVCLEVWRTFCSWALSCCISVEVTGITPASNQCRGVGNWALGVKFNMDKMQLCKSRRVTVTTPATPLRPFEHHHLLLLRLCHLPSDTFISISWYSLKPWYSLTMAQTWVRINKAHKRWGWSAVALSNLLQLHILQWFCYKGKGKGTKNNIAGFQMTSAAGNISGHCSWKNILKLNIFHDWPFILWCGFAVILYCISILYVTGLSQITSLDFFYCRVFLCGSTCQQLFCGKW